MGYYRRYYTQRDYAVTKVAIKSAGGNGIECIFFEDRGEKIVIDDKYVTVGSDNTIVTEDSVMVEDNTDTLTGCSCGNCDDPENCDCDPDTCDCKEVITVHDPFNKSHIFKDKG